MECAPAFRSCPRYKLKKKRQTKNKDVDIKQKERKVLQDSNTWKGLEENGKHQDKHIQAIDLLEGIVLETGARLIKWKVILTHRGKLFANIHHWKLKMAQRILDIPRHCRELATIEDSLCEEGLFQTPLQIKRLHSFLHGGKTKASDSVLKHLSKDRRRFTVLLSRNMLYYSACGIPIY